MSHRCCEVRPVCGTNSSWLWIGVVVVVLIACGGNQRGCNNNNCRNNC